MWEASYNWRLFRWSLGSQKRFSCPQALRCKLAQSLDNILSAVNDLITTTFNDIQFGVAIQPQPQLELTKLHVKGRLLTDQRTWWDITLFEIVQEAKSKIPFCKCGLLMSYLR